MLSFTGGLRVFLAVEPCDMRKGFEGLHGLVGERLREDVRGGALFVFSNKRGAGRQWSRPDAGLIAAGARLTDERRDGTPIMRVNGEDHRIKPGDAFRLEPKDTHEIINDTDADARMMFLKCPFLPDDKVAIK